MPKSKSVKVENKISYYVNGQLVSTNTLKQPPDMLTDDSLSSAIGIIIAAHINGNVKILNGTARITQGKQLIKEFTVHVIDKPP